MIVDLAMTVLLFFCMSFQFMEQQSHEIFGTVLFAAFILHHILNYRWYLNLGKGKYTGTRIFTTVIDFAILIDMIALMLSGMRMSGYVFKWMNLNYSMELARTVHMTASHAGFLLLGIHIGLHYGMISGMIRKMSGGRTSNNRRMSESKTSNIRENAGSKTSNAQTARKVWLPRAIPAAIGVYGAYALIKRQFFEYIFGRIHFVMFDYGESVIAFELDLAAIMILMAIIGYFLQKLIAKISMRKRP